MSTKINALDLAAEAAQHPDAEYYRMPYRDNPSVAVETLVVGDRAGQAVNAEACWGDWDEATKTIYLDREPRMRLDGSVVTDPFREVGGS